MLNAPATLDAVLPRAALAPGRPPARRRAGAPRCRTRPTVLPAPRRRGRARRRSGCPTARSARYARCGYRFYLRAPARAAARSRRRRGSTPSPTRAGGLDADACAARSSTALLEALDFARPARPTPDEVRALGADAGVELTADEVADIRALVAAFAASPLCARLARRAPDPPRGPVRVRRSSPAGGGPLVTGFLDAAAVEPDGGVLIVDYKSDRLEGAEPADSSSATTRPSGIVYALAALRDGAPRAEVAYCFLERPGEPVTARVHRRRRDRRSTERLAGLARGVIEGRYPVAAAPHRELCGDCPGRAALCSWGEDMTLREPPANVNTLH